MPLQNSNASPIFQNRTNEATGDHDMQCDKVFEPLAPLPETVGVSTLPLMTASSSSTNTAGARSPRSPSVEHSVDVQSEVEQATYVSTSAIQDDLWISPEVSDYTLSYRPFSSESTLASELNSADVSFKAYCEANDNRISVSFEEGEGGPTLTTGTNAPSSSVGRFGVVTSADPPASRPAPSNPLGLFSNDPSRSSSIIVTAAREELNFTDSNAPSMTSSQAPASIVQPPTTDYHNSTHSAPSNQPPIQLPGAAPHSLLSPGDDTEVEERRPAKRFRRDSTDFSLPHSDFILSPPITGSSYTPSLPTFSSPDLLNLGEVAQSSSDASLPDEICETTEDIAESSLHPHRRVSGRVSKPAERRAPRPWAATSSSTPLTAATRRSTRNPQYHPLGPRHLEYDYNLACEDLRAATILAAQALKYPFPSRKTRALAGKSGKRDTAEDLVLPTVAMILEAKFPDVEKARRKVNEADRCLQEALNRGETWANTAVPEALLAPTYEDADACMPPPGPPIPTRSKPGETSGTTAVLPTLSTKRIPSNNKDLTLHQRATLTHKPKEIIGKRLRIVLSSNASTHKISTDQ